MEKLDNVINTVPKSNIIFLKESNNDNKINPNTCIQFTGNDQINIRSLFTNTNNSSDNKNDFMFLEIEKIGNKICLKNGTQLCSFILMLKYFLRSKNFIMTGQGGIILKILNILNCSKNIIDNPNDYIFKLNNSMIDIMNQSRYIINNNQILMVLGQIEHYDSYVVITIGTFRDDITTNLAFETLIQTIQTETFYV